jgi:hypothetical protein
MAAPRLEERGRNSTAKHRPIRLWLSIAAALLLSQVANGGTSVYQALAAGVEPASPGDELPLLLTPRSEYHASVDAVHDDTLKSVTGEVRARRVSLLALRDVPATIEIWVERGMLARVDLPDDRLSVVRSDLLD